MLGLWTALGQIGQTLPLGDPPGSRWQLSCCGHVRGVTRAQHLRLYSSPGLDQEPLMPFRSLAARPRDNHPARPADPLAPPFYPIGLLPTMQGLLAAAADLETHYEIEREQIEQGPGSEQDKERRLAELRAAHENRCSL